ncbi:MAG: hypothetical protein M1824_001335 [Vezdaea acicularis]|nr:MAG: hypothetical protein M1824_001335 [Vezdaea acicularis]
MDLQTFKVSLGYLLATTYIFSGFRAFVDPLTQAQTYGLPLTEKTNSYLPVMGTRNIGFGLGISALLYKGDKRSAGFLLCMAIVVGALDTWAAYQHARKMTPGIWSNSVGDLACGAVGYWLTV